MYKLLLVTDQEAVKNAFLALGGLERYMFSPITFKEDAAQALAHLSRHAVDALGYHLKGSDAAPLVQYIQDHPSLPIFQSHLAGDALLEELNRTRRVLDALHADMADEDMDEAQLLHLLRDELMQQLLAGDVHSQEELLGRIKLVRANVSLNHACYLFNFDLPQGEVYLQDRWHYGRERLQSALRNNFFGRYVQDVYYDISVLTPRNIRVFACPRMGLDKTDAEVFSQVRAHVDQSIQNIKSYLDLDLDLEDTQTLSSMTELVKKA